MPEVGPAAALTAPPVPLVSHCGAALELLPQVALAPHAGAGGGDDDYLLEEDDGGPSSGPAPPWWQGRGT